MHGVRGYFDMGHILEDYPAIRANFNFVPSLLEQIAEYTEENLADTPFHIAQKRVTELSEEEKYFVLSKFFDGNYRAMIATHKRYHELHQKRESFQPDLRNALKNFSTQEILDIEVWFHLAWLGFRAIDQIDGARELLHKGSHFSEEDKQLLLNGHIAILKKLTPLYQRLSARKQVELTTTPYSHPILPLIIDSDTARRCMPNHPMPPRFHYPEDAKAQVEFAIQSHKHFFGEIPHGMWPAEGSVSPEIIPIVAAANIRWIATDEGVLFRSKHITHRERALYKAYNAVHENSSVAIIFRDHNLSDLIGFTYSRSDPREAANDFISRIKQVEQHHLDANEPILVSIILDGENPWETYPNGGAEFLHRLYEALSRDKQIRTVTMNEFLDAHPPKETIERLHSGSWIDRNFRVWIGASKTNMAWDYLGRVRHDIAPYLHNETLPAEQRAFIRRELYRAEGSDWFWWYSPDFSTSNDSEFDRLFRLHLSTIYEHLGLQVPDFLLHPINESDQITELRLVKAPTALIHPQLSGRINNFFEWIGAGYYDLTSMGGTMYRSTKFFTGLYFGFGHDQMHFRLDPHSEANLTEIREATLIFQLLVPGQKGSQSAFRVMIDLNQPERQDREAILMKKTAGANEYLEIARVNTVAFRQIFELSLPLGLIGLSYATSFSLYIQLLKKNNIELHRIPAHGTFTFHIPEADFSEEIWL
jgi:alpha-amylase/alpha-mannosidase (GH57 family)